MIDFELSEGSQAQRQMVHAVAEQAMRPTAREYDEREHEKPWDFLNMMWQLSSGHPVAGGTEKKPRQERPERNLAMCVSIEELSWGDAGLYLSIPKDREHTSELQSHSDLVCRLLLEKKKKNQ